MGLVYTIPMDRVAVSAIQDLFSMRGPAARSWRVLRAEWGQHGDAGDAQAELLPVRFKVAGSAATVGLGGSAVTPQATSRGNGTAAGLQTARINDTTQLTGGTPTVIYPFTWNVQAGFLWVPTEREFLEQVGNEWIVIDLPVAPVDPLTISGFVAVEIF